VNDRYLPYLVEPIGELLAKTAVGRDADRDGEECQRLAFGIESLFRFEVSRSWEGWPRESTTDGTSIDYCTRADHHLLDVVGTTFIDFAGARFPFRARLSCGGRRTIIEADLHIGQVDTATGHPPRLPGGTLVVRSSSPDTSISWDLIIGRRQVPAVWTRVFTWLGPVDA
jgi:hypothetical protein